MHWSKTRNINYETCPRRFFYSDIAGPRNPKIAALFDKQAPPLLRHEIVRNIINGIISEKGTDSSHLESYISSATDILTRAIDNEYEVNAQVSIVEACVGNFYDCFYAALSDWDTIYISDGKPVEFVYNKLSMMALPEIALDKGDRIQVICWKTGSRDFRDERDFYLRAGGLVCWVRSVLKILDKQVVVSEIFLRDNCEEYDFEFSDEEITAFIAKAKETSIRYSSSAKIKDFPANPDFHVCRFCPFTSICPEWLSFAEIDFSISALSKSLSAEHSEAHEPEEKQPHRSVFLSHVYEDKERLVSPLARLLESKGITYWLDEAEILWGDSLTKSINEGLRISEYLVCFISNEFIGRGWPEGELGAILSSELSDGTQRVLPIIAGDEETILHEYPLLKDKRFMKWEDGLEKILNELQAVLIRNKHKER